MATPKAKDETIKADAKQVDADKESKSDDTLNVTANATSQEASDNGEFVETVQANKEARSFDTISSVDPTDPNGYNDAQGDKAKGFIDNPVSGGAMPRGADGDVVNGITQTEGDDLPYSNVDPEGVIKKGKAKRK